MNLPYSWPLGYAVKLTKCEANALRGGTEVEASFCGVALKPILLRGVFVGPDPGQAGFDDVRNQIEAEVAGQVGDALRLAQ